MERQTLDSCHCWEDEPCEEFAQNLQNSFDRHMLGLWLSYESFHYWLLIKRAWCDHFVTVLGGDELSSGGVDFSPLLLKGIHTDQFRFKHLKIRFWSPVAWIILKWWCYVPNLLIEKEARKLVSYGKAASTKFTKETSGYITTIKIKLSFNSLNRHLEIGR